MTLDDYAIDPPPRDEIDDEQRVPVWGRCECGAYVLGAAYEEAPTVEAVCLECDRWTVATVCERPRCECGDAADVEVGGMVHGRVGGPHARPWECRTAPTLAEALLAAVDAIVSHRDGAAMLVSRGGR